MLEFVEAYDKQDGDLKDKVVVLGVPQELIEGTYNITYHVTDSDGNEAFIEVNLKVVKEEQTELNAESPQIDESDELPTTEEEKSSNNIILIVAGAGIVLVIGVAGAIIYAKKQKDDDNEE